ncbi:MAG: cyclic nucleotide-binding domain-containing protein [Sedimenticolaceae bacterium]
MTNITWLRIWVILSSTCYATYYYVFPVEPLWLDVITEAGLVLLNVVMLGWIALSALTARFDDTAQFLYDSEFSALSRHDFRTLLDKGEWCNIGTGHVFTSRGEPVEYLYYLLKGEVVAAMSEANVLKRCEGSVIGEISFRTGAPASATVTASTPCLVVRWRQRELRELCKRNTDICRAINDLIASQMARKLTTN